MPTWHSPDLIRFDDSIFVAEGAGHDSNEQPKKELQLAQAVAVQSKEGEGVSNGDQHTAPQRDTAHRSLECQVWHNSSTPPHGGILHTVKERLGRKGLQ